MAAPDIDEYLAGLAEPQRSTLETLRSTIRALAPEAEECMSYGVPGFRLGGSVIAGFAGFAHHCGFYPHSDSVLPQLGDEIAGYDTSKGTLRFPVDEPLPPELVHRLTEIRRREIDD
ncbi:iron chaperone [Ilumatobacter sp.]|uniref:iron chaperone n=1 Tax=Ilumatobacter sp. TaxID=1967498 RepID=UPI003AF4D656